LRAVTSELGVEVQVGQAGEERFALGALNRGVFGAQAGELVLAAVGRPALQGTQGDGGQAGELGVDAGARVAL
jgi:hypothetical protein